MRTVGQRIDFFEIGYLRLFFYVAANADHVTHSSSQSRTSKKHFFQTNFAFNLAK